MNNTLTKKFVIIFVLFFSITLLWQFINGQNWKSQGKIIVLGRSASEKNNINQITENILYFPYGIENIELKRIKSSGLIEVSAFGKSKSASGYLLEDSFQNIFSTISKFYNIKNEIRIQIIERKKPSSNFQKVLSKNLLSKTLLSLFASLAIVLFIKKIEPKKTLKTFQKDFYKKEKQEEQKTILPQKEKKKDYFAIKKEAPQPKEKKKTSKTSYAPQNLPLAGDEIEKMFGAEKNGLGYKKPIVKNDDSSEKKEQEKLSKGIDQNLIREATPEEVKERLNKLLGKL